MGPNRNIIRSGNRNTTYSLSSSSSSSGISTVRSDETVVLEQKRRRQRTIIGGPEQIFDNIGDDDSDDDVMNGIDDDDDEVETISSLSITTSDISPFVIPTAYFVDSPTKRTSPKSTAIASNNSFKNSVNDIGNGKGYGSVQQQQQQQKQESATVVDLQQSQQQQQQQQRLQITQIPHNEKGVDRLLLLARYPNANEEQVQYTLHRKQLQKEAGFVSATKKANLFREKQQHEEEIQWQKKQQQQQQQQQQEREREQQYQLQQQFRKFQQQQHTESWLSQQPQQRQQQSILFQPAFGDENIRDDEEEGRYHYNVNSNSNTNSNTKNRVAGSVINHAGSVVSHSSSILPRRSSEDSGTNDNDDIVEVVDDDEFEAVMCDLEEQQQQQKQLLLQQEENKTSSQKQKLSERFVEKTRKSFNNVVGKTSSRNMVGINGRSSTFQNVASSFMGKIFSTTNNNNNNSNSNSNSNSNKSNNNNSDILPIPLNNEDDYDEGILSFDDLISVSVSASASVSRSVVSASDSMYTYMGGSGGGDGDGDNRSYTSKYSDMNSQTSEVTWKVSNIGGRPTSKSYYPPTPPTTTTTIIATATAGCPSGSPRYDDDDDDENDDNGNDIIINRNPSSRGNSDSTRSADENIFDGGDLDNDIKTNGSCRRRCCRFDRDYDRDRVFWKRWIFNRKKKNGLLMTIISLIIIVVIMVTILVTLTRRHKESATTTTNNNNSSISNSQQQQQQKEPQQSMNINDEPIELISPSSFPTTITTSTPITTMNNDNNLPNNRPVVDVDVDVDVDAEKAEPATTTTMNIPTSRPQSQEFVPSSSQSYSSPSSSISAEVAGVIGDNVNKNENANVNVNVIANKNEGDLTTTITLDSVTTATTTATAKPTFKPTNIIVPTPTTINEEVDQELLSIGVAAGNENGNGNASSTAAPNIVQQAPTSAPTITIIPPTTTTTTVTPSLSPTIITSNEPTIKVPVVSSLPTANSTKDFFSMRTWTETLPLQGSENNQQYGQSVAVSHDGKILVVGAPYALQKSGVVRIYQLSKDGSGWISIASLLGRNAGDRFGHKVAVSGDGSVVAVSEPYYNGKAGGKTGNVRTYVNSPFGGYIPLGQDIEGDSATDHFGLGLALSANGRRLAVGAPYRDNSNKSIRLVSGTVKVYEWSVEKDKWGSIRGVNDDVITTPLIGMSHLDWFGWSVGLNDDGSLLCVGAPRNLEFGGYVKCFEEQRDDYFPYDHQQWTIVGDTIRNEQQPVRYDDTFGASIAVSRNPGGTMHRIAIGSPGKNGNDAFDSGLVMVYEFNPNSSDRGWIQLGKTDITGVDPGKDFQMGYSIDLHEDLLIVGAPGATYNNVGGQVEIFQFDRSRWHWKRHPRIFQGLPGSNYGSAVAITPDGTFVVGSPTDNNSGSVNVYIKD